jgi:glycosyltransferase involved in cell wall biosynthesis
MGPVILARGLAGRVPYAVKIHGSALEYTVKPAPERFLGFAREGLAGAGGILVGSSHSASSLWETMHDTRVERLTRLGPPGVDVVRFRPLAEHGGGAAEALALLAGGLRVAADADAEADAGASGAAVDDFARDSSAAAEAIAGLDPGKERLVIYVGKLIVSKGVDLLIAAWPLVLAHAPDAHLVVVGFGAYRDGLEQLCTALAGGDLERAREIGKLGRQLEGADDATPLRHLLAFLDGLAGEPRQRYLAAASALPERVSFTGRLEHAELALLLPACEAAVVPSTFPESFGMIAAEAAACGVLPISAAHSGLLEVSLALGEAVPAEARPWLSFALDEGAVPAIASRVLAWLEAEEQLRAATREALVEAVRERFSWEGVARGVIAGARGELGGLAAP